MKVHSLSSFSDMLKVYKDIVSKQNNQTILDKEFNDEEMKKILEQTKSQVSKCITNICILSAHTIVSLVAQQTSQASVLSPVIDPLLTVYSLIFFLSKLFTLRLLLLFQVGAKDWTLFQVLCDLCIFFDFLIIKGKHIKLEVRHVTLTYLESFLSLLTELMNKTKESEVIHLSFAVTKAIDKLSELLTMNNQVFSFSILVF